jgi:hypothetical protein
MHHVDAAHAKRLQWPRQSFNDELVLDRLASEHTRTERHGGEN